MRVTNSRNVMTRVSPVIALMLGATFGVGAAGVTIIANPGRFETIPAAADFGLVHKVLAMLPIRRHCGPCDTEFLREGRQRVAVFQVAQQIAMLAIVLAAAVGMSGAVQYEPFSGAA